MERKKVQVVYLNMYPNYIAQHVHLSYEEAREGCGNSSIVTTIKYNRAPDEEQSEGKNERIIGSKSRIQNGEDE